MFVWHAAHYNRSSILAQMGTTAINHLFSEAALGSKTWSVADRINAAETEALQMIELDHDHRRASANPRFVALTPARVRSTRISIC
jgi:hypothetical protein